MDKKEKFLIVASFAGSIVKFRGNLMKQLSENYDVCVACPTPNNKTLDFFKQNKITFYKLEIKNSKISPFSDLIYLAKLLLIIRNVSPKIVLPYTIKPVFYTGFIRLLIPFKFFPMITGLGSFYESHNKKFFKKLFSLLFSLSLSRANKIIFYNQGNMKQFIKDKICLEVNSVIVPGSGVDINYYLGKSKEYNNEKVIFLCSARLLKDKGICEYLEAAREIKNTYENVEFNLIGWHQDSDGNVSQSYIDTFVKDGIVNFYGYSEDVRKFLTNCDVFVLPSYHEGMPRSALEAMSMSKALLLSDIPGTQELIRNGENGYYFESKSKHSLIEAIKLILKEKEYILDFGRRSREIVVERYSDEIINNKLCKIFGEK